MSIKGWKLGQNICWKLRDHQTEGRVPERLTQSTMDAPPNVVIGSYFFLVGTTVGMQQELPWLQGGVFVSMVVTLARAPIAPEQTQE